MIHIDAFSNDTHYSASTKSYTIVYSAISAVERERARARTHILLIIARHALIQSNTCRKMSHKMFYAPLGMPKTTAVKRLTQQISWYMGPNGFEPNWLAKEKGRKMQKAMLLWLYSLNVVQCATPFRVNKLRPQIIE